MERSRKKITYHGRTGFPVIHTTKGGRKYIMVRAADGKGVRRLYSGSKYRGNGTMKRLVL